MEVPSAPVGVHGGLYPAVFTRFGQHLFQQLPAQRPLVGPGGVVLVQKLLALQLGLDHGLVAGIVDLAAVQLGEQSLCVDHFSFLPYR